MSKRIIVTGGAGFIGSNLCDYLLTTGNEVVCIDNFDDYYDPEIKRHNILQALSHSNYTLIEEDIKNADRIAKQLKGKFDAIIHLAAKAGVRYSLENPGIYYEVNVNGTRAICELSERSKIPKIIFSSSSSVYGDNPNIPWKEDSLLIPLSPYAQSKVNAENILKKFSETTKTSVIILRLFSVYGPRMRPDLMMSMTLNNIQNNIPITVYGDGNSERDYTYIEDLINAFNNCILKNIENVEIFNIGNSNPIKLNNVISVFELLLKTEAKNLFSPNVYGEPSCTFADIIKAKNTLNYKPTTKFEEGLKDYINWHKSLPIEIIKLYQTD